MSWTFYPAFLAILISGVGLTYIAVTNHDSGSPRTLSELAAAESILLQKFQIILTICGLMFACTVLGFIAPNIERGNLVVVFGVLMVGGELFLALLPARDKTTTLHEVAAQIMAVGMFGLTVLFAIGSNHANRAFELLLLVMMVAATLLTFADKKRYIAYELCFIYASHVSILIAVFELK